MNGRILFRCSERPIDPVLCLREKRSLATDTDLIRLLGMLRSKSVCSALILFHIHITSCFILCVSAAEYTSAKWGKLALLKCGKEVSLCTRNMPTNASSVRSHSAGITVTRQTTAHWKKSRWGRMRAIPLWISARTADPLKRSNCYPDKEPSQGRLFPYPVPACTFFTKNRDI